MDSVANAIVDDIGPLLEALRARGVIASFSRYEAESFGNYYVELVGSRRPFSLVRDRCEYRIDGPTREELERDDMFRIFTDREAFAKAVIAWYDAPGA